MNIEDWTVVTRISLHSNMKCPACHYVCSDLRDICPKCLLDLRPAKRAQGLPISFPDKTYAALVRKQIPSNKLDNIKSTSDAVGSIFSRLGSLFNKKSSSGRADDADELQKSDKNAEEELGSEINQGHEEKPSAQPSEPIPKSSGAGLEYQLKHTKQPLPKVIEFNESEFEESLATLDQAELEIKAVEVREKETYDLEFDFDFLEDLDQIQEDETVLDQNPAAASPKNEKKSEELLEEDIEFEEEIELPVGRGVDTPMNFSLHSWIGENTADSSIQSWIDARPAISSFRQERYTEPSRSFSLLSWLTADNLHYPNTSPAPERVSNTKIAAIHPEEPINNDAQEKKQEQLLNKITNTKNDGLDELFSKLKERILSDKQETDSYMELTESEVLIESNHEKILALFDRVHKKVANGETVSQPYDSTELASDKRSVKLDSSSESLENITFVRSKKIITNDNDALTGSNFILFPASGMKRVVSELADLFLLIILLPMVAYCSCYLLTFFAEALNIDFSKDFLTIYAYCLAVCIPILPTIYYSTFLALREATPGMSLNKLQLRLSDETPCPTTQRALRGLSWPMGILLLSPLVNLIQSQNLLDRLYGQQYFYSLNISES